MNNIVANFGQILVQKLFAYTKRKQTLPRDIYDVIWLMAQGAKIDRDFVRKNKLSDDLVYRAKRKFKKEEGKLRNFKLQLRPFLINENYVEKLELFPQVLDGIDI